MKHLFSLAMKYMRRQRFRTVLTFLCITLAVFIFHIFCDGLLLVRSAVLNDMYQWHAHHIDVTGWINESRDPDKAVDVMMHHVTVDEYQYIRMKALTMSQSRNQEGKVYYLNISVNGKSRLYNGINQVHTTEQGEHFAQQRYNYFIMDKMDGEALAEDSITLPYVYSKEGIQPGDTVEITVMP